MIAAYYLLGWGITALLALGASLIALKVFKLPPIWAVVIGMVIFAGLNIPIKTHAVLQQMPRISN